MKFKELFERVKERIDQASPTTVGFILLIIILTIGIIIRWEYVINEIGRGFHYFSK